MAESCTLPRLAGLFPAHIAAAFPPNPTPPPPVFISLLSSFFFLCVYTLLKQGLIFIIFCLHVVSLAMSFVPWRPAAWWISKWAEKMRSLCVSPQQRVSPRRSGGLGKLGSRTSRFPRSAVIPAQALLERNFREGRALAPTPRKSFVQLFCLLFRPVSRQTYSRNDLR